MRCCILPSKSICQLIAENAMRHFRAFLQDDSAYYDPPGGLLSYDLHVNEYLDPASHLDTKSTSQPITLDKFSPHFNLVNAQLVQLRHALLLCFSLNRTLILPEFFTGADRWWAPHHGLTPGSEVKSLPRKVPADIILDLESWSRGNKIRFREYSFLKNQRTAQRLKDSVYNFEICQEGKECSPSTSAYSDQHLNSARTTISIPVGMNDTGLTQFFERYKDAKVLHFQDLRDALGQNISAEFAGRFRETVQHYTSIWCCATGSPGHVWFDIFWDEANHTDRHNRFFDKWRPLLGP